jgi:hypothetical protein
VLDQCVEQLADFHLEILVETLSATSVLLRIVPVFSKTVPQVPDAPNLGAWNEQVCSEPLSATRPEVGKVKVVMPDDVVRIIECVN